MNFFGVGNAPSARIRISGGLRNSLILGSLISLLGLQQSVGAAETGSVDKDSFLKAVAQVESGNDPRAVGRMGERGVFQFRKDTWKQYTKRSFFKAHDRSVSYQVALKHYEWLYDGFIRNGYKPTPYLMASAWNSGLTRTLSGKAPSSTRNYARRVATIASDFAAKSAEYRVAPTRFFIASGE